MHRCARRLPRLLVLLSLASAGACGGSGGLSSNALLANLVLSAGTLAPAFSPTQTLYGVGPALLPSAVTVTATTAAPSATLTINGVATASGSPSAPIALPLGATAVAVVVTAEDGTTQVTTTIALQRALGGQEAYVKASNTDPGDALTSVTLGFQGPSLAIDGDTLVVGAHREDGAAAGVNGNQADNTLLDSGAAYVFVRTGGVWTQQAYLKASTPGATDFFGYAVTVSGDTLVVGAPVEDSNATGINGNEADDSANAAGAAYVFTRTAGTWSQQAYLKASNTAAGDQFGQSVSLDGDTLVVGADSEDSNATGVNGNEADNSAGNSGAAYVFVRTAGVWTQQAYLKASNAEVNDVFGRQVSLSGDTIAVGAPGEASAATGVGGNQADNTAAGSGAAYVFRRTGSTWAQEAYVKASNTGATDGFGLSLALHGDTLVVGAEREDSNATGVNGNGADDSASEAGAAYVFVRAAGAWSQQAYLKASNTETLDAFGRGVAVFGDTVLVGAEAEDSAALGVGGNQADNTANGAGAAYAFARTGGLWVQVAYLKASNAEAGDAFGGHVAVGRELLAVGAAGEDGNATGVGGNQADNTAAQSGAVYLFR